MEQQTRVLLDQVILPIGALVVSIIMGYACRITVDRLLLPFVARTRISLDGIIVRIIRTFIVPCFLVAGLALAIHLSSVPGKVVEYADKILAAVALLLLLFIATRVVSGIGQVYAQPGHRAAPVAGMLQRLAQIIIWTVGIVMVLNLSGRDITPILTTLGVAGLAAALALQDTLANFFAGFYLLADRPVRVGDYVKIQTGEEGYVVEVGWRSTKIRTLPNNVIVIPNQKLAQSIVTNYHLPERRMSLLIPVSVSYEADPDHVERILTQVATESGGTIDGFLSEPPPFVRFIPGFGAYSLDFTLICQVREFTDQYVVQHELRKRIFRRLREEGVEIPFPIQTLRFHEQAKGSLGEDLIANVAPHPVSVRITE
ncbi:MAG: mechanosensitive ion channel family protein [Chloroflexota bacterium]|nr:MAG: mechanosensitive ion channel family protein [Chloroflexota bacterium]